MLKFYSPKSQAHRVVADIDNATIKIEHLWELQGFSKEELLFWNKIKNELGTIADKIIRAYRKQ